MFTHEGIWRGIDRLANTFGYSPSGLAKTAGLDPTSFNKSKRLSPDGKPRWPSTESISKILAVTGATMSDFIALVDESSDSSGPPVPDTIPLLTLSKVHSQPCFDDEGYPKSDTWREISFPSQDDTGHIYALKVTDRSCSPVYKKNDILIVSRSAPLEDGCRVLVQTKDGAHRISVLNKKNGRSVELADLNAPDDVQSFKSSDIRWMARIIWVSQ